MTNMAGTDLYMAPEQLQKIDEHGTKTDGTSYAVLTDVYGFGSLVADLFFNIKIEQGKGLE
jgi:hypothetical protein